MTFNELSPQEKETAELIKQGLAIKRAYNKLSPREIEIAELIKQNLTSKQIGERLGISFRTVEVHRRNISRILNMKRRGRNPLKAFLEKQN